MTTSSISMIREGNNIHLIFLAVPWTRSEWLIMLSKPSTNIKLHEKMKIEFVAKSSYFVSSQSVASLTIEAMIQAKPIIIFNMPMILALDERGYLLKQSLSSKLIFCEEKSRYYSTLVKCNRKSSHLLSSFFLWLVKVLILIQMSYSDHVNHWKNLHFLKRHFYYLIAMLIIILFSANIHIN